MPYRDYTDSDIVQHAKEVYSIAGLLRCLNLRAAGGNYGTMRRKLKELNVDTTHWTGQGWNKDQQLKPWSKYTKLAGRKKCLLRERGHRCEKCGYTTWNGAPIPLELHHCDGDGANNSADNLMLLCCNCHAQTDTWRNRKRN